MSYIVINIKTIEAIVGFETEEEAINWINSVTPNGAKLYKVSGPIIVW